MHVIISAYLFFQAIPEDAINDESEDEDKVNPDERNPQAALDKRVSGENELSDSEDEGTGGRRDNRSYKQRKRPRLDDSNTVLDSTKPKEETPSTPNPIKGINLIIHFYNLWFSLLCSTISGDGFHTV